jgi:hypothetical protein
MRQDKWVIQWTVKSLLPIRLAEG